MDNVRHEHTISPTKIMADKQKNKYVKFAVTGTVKVCEPEKMLY
jgi:hypothetical protein